MSDKEARKILGIDDSVELNEEIVKKAYREASKKTHPDLNPFLEDAKEKFQLINEANETLSRLLMVPGFNYHVYTSQKILNLEKKYINNLLGKKSNLNVVSKIEKRINNLKEVTKKHSDIQIFDDDYKYCDERIRKIVSNFKQNRKDLLVKKCLKDSETKKMYDEFCVKIDKLNNVYLIDDEYNNYYKNMANIKIDALNDIYLEAQKESLVRTYIGNKDFNNELFTEKAKDIRNKIDNFFNTVNIKQSVKGFEIICFIESLTLVTEIDEFKNSIFDNIINKSLYKKYPYASEDISRKKISIKGHNLLVIYNVYNETLYSVKEAIVYNICDKLEKVIEKNKNLKYFNAVSDAIRKKYFEIVNNLNIDINKDDKRNYVEEMNNEILELVSNYGFLDKERYTLLKKFENKGILEKDDEIVDSLNKANTIETLKDILEVAKKHYNEIINNDMKTMRQRKVSSIKSILNIKSLSKDTYDNYKKQDIVEKLDIIFDRYLKEIISNIDMLLDINFIDYEKDLRVINNFLDNKNNVTVKEDVVESEVRNSNNNNNDDDGFSAIEEIFRNRDRDNRRKNAEQLYDAIVKKYKSNYSNLSTSQKLELFLGARNVINEYLSFKINDISDLIYINFNDYYSEIDILNSILDNKNNTRH